MQDEVIKKTKQNGQDCHDSSPFKFIEATTVRGISALPWMVC